MKNLASAIIVLACVSGIVSLPAVYNAGNYAVSTQFSPLGQFKFSPGLAALFQLYAPSSQSAYVNPPATYASATPPSAGVNIGGGTGGKPGSITTTVPNSAGGVVNVPAGSSVTVTGGNGSVSGAGSANQGNGGSIAVTAGSGNGDNSTANTGSDASASDSS